MVWSLTESMVMSALMSDTVVSLWTSFWGGAMAAVAVAELSPFFEASERRKNTLKLLEK